MSETTSDIENIEIRTALKMFFEQSNLLATEATEFSNYCGNLKRPIVPNVLKYVDPASEHLKTVSIARRAYDTAKDTADRSELDRRMMSLVTASVDSIIQLRGELQIESTKLRSLHQVRSKAETQTLRTFSNACLGLIAFMGVIGFLVYLFTR